MKIAPSFYQLLPTLNALINLASKRRKINLNNTVFVCVQHLLYTTVNLFEALIALGAKPDNIYVMGKLYSASPKVIEILEHMGINHYKFSQPNRLGCFNEFFINDVANMWKEVEKTLLSTKLTKVKKIVVLDDGGKCILNVPKAISNTYPIVGVEQTSSGFNDLNIENTAFPVINVAFSAAKQYLEPTMITEAVIRKLKSFLPEIMTSHMTCGVVGLGVIGKALTNELVFLNQKVIVYDNEIERRFPIEGALLVDDMESLVAKADYIFGCAGKDVTNNLNLNSIQADKTFISCSSQDKEFLSLLKFIQQANGNPTISNPLDNVEFRFPHGPKLRILYGGFPINLDNTGESVRSRDIQLTRGLLLGGMIQGLIQLSHGVANKLHYMLHPEIQKFIVNHWIPTGTPGLIDAKLLNKFKDPKWIKEHSSGQILPPIF